VEHAVIGAMALAFHGVIRASLDADALLFLEGRSVESLADEFRKSGFMVEVRIGDVDDPIPALIVLQDSHENRVDLLAGLRNLDSKAASRTVPSDFEGVPLRFIGIEDLIAMKLFAGSQKDLDDARQAMAVSRASLDVSLLQELALRFGRKERTLLDSFLGESGG